QIDHALGGNDDDQLLDIDFSSLVRLTDADGDFVDATGGFVISIEDDFPINQQAGLVNVSVHEDALNNAQSVGNGEGADPGQTTSRAITAAALADTVSVGADEPVIFTLNTLAADADASADDESIDGEVVLDTAGNPVTSGGSAVVYKVDGGEIQGIVVGGNDDGSDRVVFTLTADIDADGGFVVTLVDQIDHPTASSDAAGDRETLGLNLSGAFIATDADGDYVVLDSAVTVQIEDDIPINQQAGLVDVTVHEDALNNAQSVGNGESPAQTVSHAITAAVLATTVSVGADEPVTFTLNTLAADADESVADESIDGEVVLDTAGNPVTSGGPLNAVVYKVVEGEIQGVVVGDGVNGSDRVVFTLTADADGGFVVTLVDQIDHPTASSDVAGDRETLGLNLSGAFIATDADGDYVVLDSAVTVQIEDDTPVVNEGVSVTGLVHEDALVGGNAEVG
ncbi:hypothetical protein, partial [Halopseudomonas sp.]|uniref:hypothetical protein n=1 Tax=Halopseudomonas sp. TaxID=2901191 RepID=UPI0030017A43